VLKASGQSLVVVQLRTQRFTPSTDVHCNCALAQPTQGRQATNSVGSSQAPVPSDWSVQTLPYGAQTSVEAPTVQLEGGFVGHAADVPPELLPLLVVPPPLELPVATPPEVPVDPLPMAAPVDAAPLLLELLPPELEEELVLLTPGTNVHLLAEQMRPRQQSDTLAQLA
jgi:hypothetical protein